MTSVAAREPRRNIFLVGLMGAGKTSVGRLLAKDLEQQERDTYESWAAVENLLLTYDELGPAMTVVRNV